MKKLSKYISWLVLKKMTNTKLSRLTILVPLLGWFLIYNDNIFKILNESFNMDLSISLSWKLHCFYLGLTCIAISVVFYIIFCPEKVNKYLDEFDYIKSESRIYTIENDKRTSSKININPIEWTFPETTYRNPSNGEYPLTRIYEKNEEKIIDQMSTIFETENFSKNLIRIISFSFFLVGITLTMVPTFFTIMWSIEQLIP